MTTFLPSTEIVMDTLLSIFRTSNHIVALSLADLDEEIARRRTRGDEGPSITWTIGHLLNYRLKVLAYLGDQRPNPWADSFDETPATDGSDYPSISVMRDEWQRMHQDLEHAFQVAPKDVLDRAAAKAGIHGEQRLFDKVAFLAWHEAYHVGVIGSARTAVGLDGPAVLARAAAAAS